MTLIDDVIKESQRINNTISINFEGTSDNGKPIIATLHREDINRMLLSAYVQALNETTAKQIKNSSPLDVGTKPEIVNDIISTPAHAIFDHAVSRVMGAPIPDQIRMSIFIPDEDDNEGVISQVLHQKINWKFSNSGIINPIRDYLRSLMCKGSSIMYKDIDGNYLSPITPNLMIDGEYHLNRLAIWQEEVARARFIKLFPGIETNGNKDRMRNVVFFAATKEAYSLLDKTEDNLNLIPAKGMALFVITKDEQKPKFVSNEIYSFNEVNFESIVPIAGLHNVTKMLYSDTIKRKAIRRLSISKLLVSGGVSEKALQEFFVVFEDDQKITPFSFPNNDSYAIAQSEENIAQSELSRSFGLFLEVTGETRDITFRLIPQSSFIRNAGEKFEKSLLQPHLKILFEEALEKLSKEDAYTSLQGETLTKIKKGSYIILESISSHIFSLEESSRTNALIATARSMKEMGATQASLSTYLKNNGVEIDFQALSEDTQQKVIADAVQRRNQ